jgi:hypothetical protein
VDCCIVEVCATKNTTRSTITEVTNDETTNRCGTSMRMALPHIVVSHHVVPCWAGTTRHRSSSSSSLLQAKVRISRFKSIVVVAEEEVDAALFNAVLIGVSLARRLDVSLVVLAARPVSCKL